MDHFRTEVNPPKAPVAVEHTHRLLLMGSCFATDIGQRLAQSKFRVLQNPFGILFNPFSIVNALSRICSKRHYRKADLVQVDDKWVSLDHHGDFSGASPEEVLSGINTSIDRAHEFLRSARVLFITSGTAWTYHHVARQQTVANCHKLPNKEFEKRLLGYQDVHLTLRHIPQLLERVNPDLNIVFTISPVRHWKDGASENQRSKSLLVAATHAVVDEFDQCHYFPSYELLMDDLRDYRFYKADMLHPSEQAIDYVWEKFGNSFFSQKTKHIIRDVYPLIQAVSHRPVDPESNSFQRFAKKQLEVIRSLEGAYPELDFSDERAHFERFLL